MGGLDPVEPVGEMLMWSVEVAWAPAMQMAHGFFLVGVAEGEMFTDRRRAR